MDRQEDNSMPSSSRENSGLNMTGALKRAALGFFVVFWGLEWLHSISLYRRETRMFQGSRMYGPWYPLWHKITSQVRTPGPGWKSVTRTVSVVYPWEGMGCCRCCGWSSSWSLILRSYGEANRLEVGQAVKVLTPWTSSERGMARAGKSLRQKHSDIVTSPV